MDLGGRIEVIRNARHQVAERSHAVSGRHRDIGKPDG
jgi:hypothetical protein